MARVSFVSGIFVSIQLGIVFVLLGLASAIIVLGAVFLMVGAWTVIHGLAYESDKVFWTGWGAGVAILASITVLPLSYTLALILIVIIALIVFGMIRSRTSTRAGNWQEGSSKNSHELAFASVSTLFFIL